MKIQLDLDEATCQLILNVKKRHDAGETYRHIADDLGISKSKAERLCKKWTPLMEDTKKRKSADAVENYYFPGREEYVEAGRDPRFDCLYEDESEANYRLRREAYLIEAACAKARKEYLKTGKAPKLAEMLAKMSEPPALAGCQIVEQESTYWPPTDAGGSDKTSGLRRSFDAYGREIFIEKDGMNGKPDIWYDFDSKGRKRLKLRKGNTVLIEKLE
jgi:hypothetical protein